MAKVRKPKSEPQKAPTPDTQGKRVTFDQETWQALDVLARDRMMTFQELADEAFRDVLKKHGRPMDTLDAFRKSARQAAANTDAPEKTKAQKANGPPGGGHVPKPLPPPSRRRTFQYIRGKAALARRGRDPKAAVWVKA